MKSKDQDQVKENKAIALGVKIFTVDELENY
jgi:hypothetical protein